MLDWIFGSDKDKEKKTQKKESKQYELSQDQIWIYDYLRQYLTSPIWRNPILDFVESNCQTFEDTEQNKFEYTKIYQQFQGLTTLLLESMIEETGITESTLQKCIVKGLKNEKHRKIFSQLLLCDNFISFKRMMIAKNKQLELQAAKQIQFQNPNHKIQIDVKQLQRLEVQKAIAMSLALQQKATLAQQQKEFQQAIRLSKISLKEQSVKKQQQPQKQKQSLLGPLPPIVIGSNRMNRTINQFKQQSQTLKKQILEMKSKQEIQEKQSADQRKKRLLQQRQLIRKKKQQQRKEQLNTFVQNKPTNEGSDPKINQQQLQRRKNLMKKLKQQLKE